MQKFIHNIAPKFGSKPETLRQWQKPAPVKLKPFTPPPLVNAEQVAVAVTKALAPLQREADRLMQAERERVAREAQIKRETITNELPH